MPTARRQIVVDTETTGLKPSEGHRVVEIGCVELLDRRIGNHYQVYLNPERAMPEEALAVHGLDDAFLAEQPRFAEIRHDFLAFVEGAELIAHNAPFDLGFLDAELERAGGAQRLADCTDGVIDTLALSRRRHPGAHNSLDALCRRYHVDLSARERHGALLDAQLLAHVYLAMSGGQLRIALDLGAVGAARHAAATRGAPVLRATAAELAEHRQFLAALRRRSGSVQWSEEGADTPAPGGLRLASGVAECALEQEIQGGHAADAHDDGVGQRHPHHAPVGQADQGSEA